ncbi:MAG TPA: hypothetical protein VGM13_11120 [Thermoanaerobaculia bacterium]|jgi:hypothetical protein
MRKAVPALAAVVVLLSSSAAAQLVNSFHFVPVVVKAPGLNGTFWQSDIAVSNIGTSTVKVGMRFFPSDVANTFDGSLPFWDGVLPGQTRFFEDVLGQYLSYFPAPAGTKGFMVVADITPVNCNVSSPPTSYPGLLAVTSRTYNTGDPKGTYSTAADPNLTGMNYTTYPSVIPGVRHTGTAAPGFRTNLSAANFSTARIRILVKIFNGAGTLVVPESTQTIEALSFRQWALSDFGVTSLGSAPGRIEVRLDPVLVANPCTSVTDTFCSNPCDPTKCPTKYAMKSQPTFFVYASTVDNGTGDGVLLSPVIDWQGYYKWAGDYKKGHCPSIRAYENNLLSDWFHARGLIEPDPPPTFKKVGSH